MKKPKTKVEDKLKQKDMSFEIKTEDNSSTKEASITYVGCGSSSLEYRSLLQTLEGAMSTLKFMVSMVLAILIILVIMIVILWN